MRYVEARIQEKREATRHDAFGRAMESAREAIMEAALNDVPSRLDKNGKAYFEFITMPGIGPANNLAEQAVRFVVVDRRTTQGTRSKKGRETNERPWTVVGTCAMQGRSAYEFIPQAVQAHFKNTPAPSLLPGST